MQLFLVIFTPAVPAYGTLDSWDVIEGTAESFAKDAEDEDTDVGGYRVELESYTGSRAEFDTSLKSARRNGNKPFATEEQSLCFTRNVEKARKAILKLEVELNDYEDEDDEGGGTCYGWCP